MTASTYKVNQLSGSQTQLWLVDNSTDEKFVGPTQVTCEKLFKKETIFAKLLLLEHLLGNYTFQRSFLSQKYFPKRMFLYVDSWKRKKDLRRGTFFTNVPFKNAPIFPTSLPNVNVWLCPYFFWASILRRKHSATDAHITSKRDETDTTILLVVAVRMHLTTSTYYKSFYRGLKTSRKTS